MAKSDKGKETGKQDKDVKRLRKLVKEIRVAMLTTVSESGHLRSRPMITLDAQPNGDVWFLTRIDAPKNAEIRNEASVNVSYASPEKDRYVSLSGTAQLVSDQAKLQESWKPRFRRWFPEGRRDSNLGLLKVSVTRAEYWDKPNRRMVELATYVRGKLTPGPEASQPSTMSDLAGVVKSMVTRGAAPEAGEGRKVDIEPKDGQAGGVRA